MREKTSRLLPLLFLLLAGCSYPALRIRDNQNLEARDNLVRFLANRAIAAHYQGNREEFEESLALAWELYDEPPGTRVPYWKLDLEREGQYPRFLLYTAYPGMPRHRRYHGRDARKILYPIWGLPFDLAEAPLKAYTSIPVLGIGSYAAPKMLGEDIMEYAFDDPDEDFRDQLSAFCFGAALSIAPDVTLNILNGLPAIVYPSDWEGRMNDWKHCALWWAPDAVDDLEFQGNIASAFFPNARRISGRDPRIKELRDQIRAFRRESLEAHNKKLCRVNTALDELPEDATMQEARTAVFEALCVPDYRKP